MVHLNGEILCKFEFIHDQWFLICTLIYPFCHLGVFLFANRHKTSFHLGVNIIIYYQKGRGRYIYRKHLYILNIYLYKTIFFII